MAQHVRDFSTGAELVDSLFQLVHVNRELRIRQLDGSGVYSPSGLYASGRITIDAWHPNALRAVTGFKAYGDSKGTDAILFRLSPDSGTTEMWWNGTAWVTAVDPVTDWNLEDVVDAHIATFPIGDGITQIVRLVSGNGRTTPALHSTYIFYEALYESTVDLMDSLARTLASSLSIQGVFQVTVPIPAVPPGVTPAPSAVVTIDDPIWTVNAPILVFNDGTDPHHRNNLFVSMAAGNVITMSSAQTGLLTVFYRGTLDLSKIHIASDMDVELADLPAIVLQTPTATRVRYENTPRDTVEEPLRSRSVVRIRRSPTFQDVMTLIQCNAAYELHARKLRDAVRQFLETLENIRSRALDEPLVRTVIGPITSQNDLKEQTYTFNLATTFTVIDWPTEYSDVPSVTSVLLRQGGNPKATAASQVALDSENVSIE